jgi:hypothetical protein
MKHATYRINLASSTLTKGLEVPIPPIADSNRICSIEVAAVCVDGAISFGRNDVSGRDAESSEEREEFGEHGEELAAPGEAIFRVRRR